MLPLVLLLTTLTALAISYLQDPERTKKALGMSGRSSMALVPTVLAMTALVGLTLALTPPELLARLFELHGVAGFALVSVIGAIVTMPAPVAFPLAGTLLKSGVSLPALAAFITTLTMVGIVTAPMEIDHFGRRFTVVRQTSSFVLAVLIGALMAMVLR